MSTFIVKCDTVDARVDNVSRISVLDSNGALLLLGADNAQLAVFAKGFWECCESEGVVSWVVSEGG